MTDDERKDWELIKRNSLGMFRTACRRLNEPPPADVEIYGPNVVVELAPVQRQLTDWQKSRGVEPEV
jgi:hypothetical protein